MNPKLISAGALLATLLIGTSAQAATFSFTTGLNAANEPGTVISPATGTATLTFDDVAKSVTVFEQWQGLTSAITVNHIHCCTAVPGVGNISPVIDLAPGTATTGSYTATFVAGATPNFTLAEFAPLLTGTQTGKAYVNLHTANNTGGEIRGFLAPVPEPETYALMALGLGVVGFWTRRRGAR